MGTNISPDLLASFQATPKIEAQNLEKKVANEKKKCTGVLKCSQPSDTHWSGINMWIYCPVTFTEGSVSRYTL